MYLYCRLASTMFGIVCCSFLTIFFSHEVAGSHQVLSAASDARGTDRVGALANESNTEGGVSPAKF